MSKMINYVSTINYLSIKLITCQNKLIADQKMIDDRGQSPYKSTTKVKVVTPKCLGPIISKTTGDTDSVTIDHL